MYGDVSEILKSKMHVSENEELRHMVKHVEGLLDNVMTLLQH